MTGRRQSLCVLLLLVMLSSAMYVSTPAQKPNQPDQAGTAPVLSSGGTGTDPDKQVDMGASASSIPTAIYPSSSVGWPTPSSEPTPDVNSPTIFDYHHIAEAQALGTPAYTGSDVRVSVLDYGLDMGQPDLNGSQFVQPSGPYAGWPVAFDPMSMGKWLRDEKYEGTWYANTTREGQPPFEVTHYILVDGRRDFGDSELLKEDPPGTGTGSLDGPKMDYDLTKLYVTHDEKFWYFGWPVTQFLNTNLTYGLMIDVNNETGGTTSVPEGKLVSTNTTHSGNPPTDLAVNDVTVSPDGTMIATTSSDKHVKVWRLDGIRLYDFAPDPLNPSSHTSNPYSLAWSPDSRFLASRDKSKLIVWDVVSGRQAWWTTIKDSTMDITPPDERFSSSIAFSPNGQWIAVGADARVSVFLAATGRYVGNVSAATGGIIRSVAFNPTNPTPPQIAIGADTYGLFSNTVRIYPLDATNLQNVRNPPVAVASWNSTIPAFGGHTDQIFSVAWSPDGLRIASTSKDNSVRLWNPPSTSPLMYSTLHGNWVYDVAWERSAPYRFATVSRSPTLPKAPLRLWGYNGNSLGYFDLNRSTYAVDWTNSGELVTASLDLSARITSTSGSLQRILVANKPDFAVMIDAGMNYSMKDLKWEKVVYNGTFFSWNDTTSSWSQGNEVTKPPINGTQAFFGVDELFVELGVPTSILGNPSGISVEMFSVARDKSHAQDSVPIDGTVFDVDGNGKTDGGTADPSRPAIDFTPVVTPLSAFQYVPVTYYKVDTVAIHSVSGDYHFGYHPSQKLAQLFGSLGLLVVDPNQNGTYERVYLDMDRNTCDSNHIFDSRDVWVDKSHPVATCNQAGTIDSTPDISAGMIYFISDGVNNIPYSERFRELNGITNLKKPGNGELVAFAGEFRMDPDTNYPLTHGTEIASIIASRGRIDSARMKGIAPGVKLIPIVNALDDIISSWYFAVEGYDKSPATGDEAQIVLNPFEYPRTKDDGYDVYSRTADYLSTSYAQGRTVFFGPAGEEGFGYGSVASPAASPGIITVGRTVDGSMTTVEGTSIHYNNIAFRSSRGPTVSGFPKPDFVAIGNTAYDEPIIFRSDGAEALTDRGNSGSEISAAVAAGVAALLMDAAERIGRNLTASDIRNYLMSGAENLGYDILLQGAGFLNASRSMQLLLGSKDKASVFVSPPSWVPGLYKSSKPDSFTKLLFPGDGDQTTFTVENRDTKTVSLSLSGEMLTKWDGYVFTNKTTLRNSNDIFLWINKSGVFVEDLSTFPPGFTMIAPPLPQQIWDDSENLQVTAFGPYGNLIVPSGVDGFTNLYCYDMILMDWTMDPFGYGHPSLTWINELNTIDMLDHTANVLEARVHHPGAELHDALVIQLKRHLENDACGRSNLEWTFNVDFFQRVPWSILSLDKTSISLNAGGSTTVTASIQTPADMAMGSYEGAVYVYDSTNKHEITIPILVNVGARTPNFKFGGNLPATGLNDVSRLYGGRDLTLLGSNVRYPYTGDWRYFYVWLPDDGINVAGASIKMVIQLNWTVKPSDIDMVALTPATAADVASQFASTRFGPKSVREVVSSEAESRPNFKTLSNSSQDYISFQLSGGLNVIALHQMILNGDKPYEIFSGSGMWWRVPREVRKATQSLSGSVGGNAMLSDTLIGGLRVDAVGPAISSKNSSELIKQDWQEWMSSLPFGSALAKGSYTLCLLLESVIILDIKLTGLSDVEDLDLGLFRDTNADCKLEEADTTGASCSGVNCDGSGPQWALSAGATAAEEIRWKSPPDGRYIIKILGYNVPGGAGHFDLEVQQTLATGSGYMIPEAPPPEQLLIGTKPVLPPFNIVSYSMTWDFSGNQKDGNYSGAVRFGTATAAGIVVVPAMIVLDRQAPVISSFVVTSQTLLVNTTDPTLTNDPRPTLVVSLEDRQMGSLDRDTFRMVLDDVEVTTLMSASVILTTNFYVTPAGPYGRWSGTMKYSAINPLENGIHTLYVAAGDEARNFVHANYTFTIDMESPPLALAGLLVEYLRQNTVMLQGSSDPNAYVLIGGTWRQLDATGQFSVPLTLEEGNNVIDVTATRWFQVQKSGSIPANTVTMQKRYVYDITPPSILGVTTDPSILPINTQTVRLSGRLADNIAPGTPLANYSMLKFTINGAPVSVFPDGSFSVVLPTQEGQNSYVLYAEDPAGNNVTSTPLLITRDTVAPVIEISGVPERVETDRVTVTVTSESGLRVTVNGFDAPEDPTGTYTKVIGLSGGSNTIVITAQDSAKNTVERRITIEYAAPAGLGRQLFGPAGGAGSIAFIAILVIIVVIVVFLVIRWMRGRGGAEEEGEVGAVEAEVPAEEPVGAPEEEELEAEEIAEPSKPAEGPPEAVMIPPSAPQKPLEIKPPEEAAKQASTLVVFRVTRAKLALDQGKISQKVYEQNLASMGLTVTEADKIIEEAEKAEQLQVKSPPAEKKAPTKEDKIKAFRKALDEGRITQEVYEANIKRIQQR